MSRLWAIVAASVLLGCASEPHIAPPPKARVPAGEPLAVLFSEIDRSLAGPESQIDLAYLSVLMSRVMDPSVDAERTLQDLDRMALEARGYFRALDDLRTKLGGISRYLFGTLKITVPPAEVKWNGREGDYRWIHQVLQTRQGICGSLSMLYVGLAHRLKLDVCTAMAPYHVFIRASDSEGPFNIEPTRGGQVLSDHWYVETMGARPGKYHLRPLSRREQIAGMLGVELSNDLRQVGRNKEALSCLKRAAALWSYPGIALNLASLLGEMSRDEEALACLDRALESDSDEPRLLNNKAILLVDMNRLTEALECVDKALGLKPDDIDFLVNRSVLLQRLGKSDEALAAADRVVQFDFRAITDLGPKGVDRRLGAAIGVKAWALDEMGRHEEAQTLFEKASKLRVQDEIFWNNWGDSLFRLKRYSESLVCFDKALALKPRYAVAFAGKARALARLNRLDDALAAATSGTEFDPKDGRIWIAKAVVHAARGEKKEARFSAVQAKKPGSPLPESFLKEIEE